MNKNIEIMARTIYGEARGEYLKKTGGIDSLIAVGNVIMNRHLKSKESIEKVCLKPKQFSCWNKNDPNKKIIESVDMKDEIYKICYETAIKIITGKTEDITKGANHYYSKFMKTAPFWAAGKNPTVTIANHIFFKL